MRLKLANVSLVLFSTLALPLGLFLCFLEIEAEGLGGRLLGTGIVGRLLQILTNLLHLLGLLLLGIVLLDLLLLGVRRSSQVAVGIA